MSQKGLLAVLISTLLALMGIAGTLFGVGVFMSSSYIPADTSIDSGMCSTDV